MAAQDDEDGATAESRDTGEEVITVDVAILGGGSAAEALAGHLASDRRVAVIEAHLVGGECPYTACIPSKAMLLSALLRDQMASAHEIGASAQAVPVGDGAEAFRIAAGRRDDKASHQDDSGHVASLRDKGVKVIRGRGQLDGRRAGHIVVEVDAEGQRIVVLAEDVVIATGAGVSRPPIDGLDLDGVWTFEDAWTAPDRPDRLLVLGGGAVGCEIAQAFARYGAAVTLVQRSGLLGGSVDPVLGDDLADALREDGIDVRTSTEVQRIRRATDGDGVLTVLLDDGTDVIVDRVVLATGKTPNVHGIGLDTVGLADGEPLVVDDRGRVLGADHLWALGDVTGGDMFTHTANYQGRVVGRNLLGQEAVADLRAVPRTVYTQPQVAAVGQTADQAAQAGHDVATITFDLSATSRGYVSTESAGSLVLVADREDRVLLGAGMVAPHAGESIGEFALAIKARISVDVLADVIHPFPTWSEAFDYAFQDLLSALDD